jgi:hypothetical protein
MRVNRYRLSHEPAAQVGRSAMRGGFASRARGGAPPGPLGEVAGRVDVPAADDAHRWQSEGLSHVP